VTTVPPFSELIAATTTSAVHLEMRDAYTPRDPRFMAHPQISAMFGGLPLVAPGVVPVSEWRPAVAGNSMQPADLYAGVARTPGARM